MFNLYTKGAIKVDKSMILEAVTKSALNLVPGVGGALASILGDYCSARKDERLMRFIEQFFNEIDQKQELLVREYICSEDFLDIFENILSDVMKTRTEMKRNMLKNLLVNSCTTQNTPYERTEEFQHLIDVLTPTSLLILVAFYNLQDIHMNGEERDIEKCWAEIKRITRIENEIVLLDYIGELEARSLVEAFKNNTYHSGSGIVYVDDRPYITEKGLLFYRYIMACEESVPAIVRRNHGVPKVQIVKAVIEEVLHENEASDEEVKALFDEIFPGS